MRLPHLPLPLLLLATTPPQPASALPLPALSLPINLLFGIRIPTSTPPTPTPPKLLFSGYAIPLPPATQSGVLISWLANYESSTAYTTQLAAFDPAAPRTVTVDAEGRAAAPAPGDAVPRVLVTSFSSGDVAGAVRAALGQGPRGVNESTAVASAAALGRVFLATAGNANLSDVLNTPSLQNAKAAETVAAASFCTLNSSVVVAAPTLSSGYVPVSGTPEGQQQAVGVEAVVGCAPGVEAPRVDESRGAASSEGVVLADVQGWVRCDGRSASAVGESTVFRVAVVGVYTLGRGFSGAVGGERVGKVEGEC